MPDSLLGPIPGLGPISGPGTGTAAQPGSGSGSGSGEKPNVWAQSMKKRKCKFLDEVLMDFPEPSTLNETFRDKEKNVAWLEHLRQRHIEQRRRLLNRHTREYHTWKSDAEWRIDPEISMVHLGPKDMGAGGAMLPESVALITPKLASSIATSGSAAEPSKALAALPAQYRTVTVHRSQLKLSEALAKKTAEWSNVEFAAMLAREGYWLRKEMADEEIDLRLMQAQEREMVQQYVHRMGKAEEYGARERNDAAGIGSSKGLGHRGSISTTTGSDIVMGGNKTSTEGLGSKPRHPPPSITIPPIRGPGSNPNSGPNSAVSPTTVRTIRFPESTVPQPPTLGTVPGPGQVRDPRLPPPDPRLQRAAVPAATGIGMGTADTGNTAGVIGRQDPPPPPRVPVAHMCPTTPTPNLATHLQGLLPQPPTSSDTLGGGR